MQVTTKTLDDGSLEFVLVLSAEEIEEYKKVGEESSAVPLSGIPNPFDRKSKYCVTCNNGHRETIEAYGDAHAFIIAASICGAGFGIYNGECRI